MKQLIFTKHNNKWFWYHSPQNPLHNVYGWCVQTFGPPGAMNNWDQHGGWYFFYDQEYVTAFKLRWEGVI